MKTLKEVTKEIETTMADIAAQRGIQNSSKDEDKIEKARLKEKRLSKHLKFLTTAKLYLEKTPREGFIQETIDKTEAAIQEINTRAPRLEQFEGREYALELYKAALKQHNDEYRLSDKKKHLKLPYYLLNKNITNNP